MVHTWKRVSSNDVGEAGYECQRCGLFHIWKSREVLLSLKALRRDKFFETRFQINKHAVISIALNKLVDDEHRHCETIILDRVMNS